MTIERKKLPKEHTFSLYVAVLVFLSCSLSYIYTFILRYETHTGINVWYFGKHIFLNFIPSVFELSLYKYLLTIILLPFFILTLIRAEKGSTRGRLLWFAFLGLFTYIFIFHTILFIGGVFPFFTVYSLVSLIIVVLCLKFLAEGFRGIIKIPYPVTSRVDDFFTGAFFLYKGIAITYLLILPIISEGIFRSYYNLLEKYLISLFLILNTGLVAAYILAVRQITRKTYSHLTVLLLSLDILPDIPLLTAVGGKYPLAALLLFLTPLILLKRYFDGLKGIESSTAS